MNNIDKILLHAKLNNDIKELNEKIKKIYDSETKTKMIRRKNWDYNVFGGSKTRLVKVKDLSKDRKSKVKELKKDISKLNSQVYRLRRELLEKGLPTQHDVLSVENLIQLIKEVVKNEI
jgi:hypothetical protein